jgi:SET domain-containing protein
MRLTPRNSPRKARQTPAKPLGSGAQSLRKGVFRLPRRTGRSTLNIRFFGPEPIGFEMSLRQAVPRVNRKFSCFQLHIHHSPIDRLGVFAGEMIPAGKRVIQYTGERISDREATRRAVKQFLAGKAERIYLVRLKRNWKIDGWVGGSGAQFINHSCDPNLTMRRMRGRIFLYSLRKIRPGEELTADYGFRCACPCNCGSRHCRGTMCHT